ncbi:glutathione S-transferase [Copidosoma floridanum]|uniref:glutathione S-transferase n=1 Tax=Copidosoma floridanum TaxID=29053 RepID=UPI0006C97D95|nr:glutathione S-transferase [Copidosoma floridanum]
MLNYKLYYFNVTGLGEPIRYLLHYCGVEFEDYRFQDFDEWKNHFQDKMPMRQVPVLEIDGCEKLHQHISICRYFGKKFNLCGSTLEEDQRIDEVMYDINDMRLSIANYYNETVVEFKAALKERMLSKLSFFLGKLDMLASKNGQSFVRGGITWVDIYYAGISEVMSNILERDINEDYANLTKLVAHVRNNNRIKAYLEKRPKTII